MKRLFLLLALVGMVAVGCTEGGIDDNINNGGNNTEQPGEDDDDDTNDEAIEIPSNEIWYTTTDNKRIILPSTEPTVFGAYFISNTYSDGKGVLTFDGEITKIGNDAFKDIGNLASITIPDSVTSIGGEAFRRCTSLTSITIPNSVTSIGDYAFSGCDSLTSVTIPDSVTEIGDDAFSRCISLTSVTIPDSVTSIGYNAFCGCTSLTSITIPNSVTSIGDNAFYDCSMLQEFKGKFASDDGRCLIQDGTLIAFAPEGLTEYAIPDSVTSIGDYAFSGCDSLTSITIPDSVTSIGSYAFGYCTSLEEVYCKPTTPPTGGCEMFYNNASDRTIYVPSNSVSAYRSASDWYSYASAIVGYDF